MTEFSLEKLQVISTGLLELPWWGYALYVLGMTHVTIAAVTIFLHRSQAHRALDLHPAASHFFRFWLWLTTGMITRTWVAIHRKHHARCETAEDPHSPQVEGLSTVLWRGAELYRREAANAATLEKYGNGTPDDWLESRLYRAHPALGIGLMLAVDVALFGFIGLTLWAIQMLWIPFFAAGVINGIGHAGGYRIFQPEDASTNIVPWGLLIGGEELHNNHHAYPSSARFAHRWFELDLGWLYIRALESVGLARVKKVAPPVRIDAAKTSCDEATVRAVIVHRYEVLGRYAQAVRGTCAAEIRRLKAMAVGTDWASVKRMLHLGASALAPGEREKVGTALDHSRVLRTVCAMRQDLIALWARSSATNEQLARHLEDWCERAERSGIAALGEFSRRLRCYA
jgi:stearoyl-CoA desaturase (Delta-9 desaturase)